MDKVRIFELRRAKGTVWEGGMIPLLMDFTFKGGAWEADVNNPPRVKLPKGFFMTNVYPSGCVCDWVRSFPQNVYKAITNTFFIKPCACGIDPRFVSQR